MANVLLPLPRHGVVVETGVLPGGDLELARRVAAGDADAFARIVRRHSGLLFRTARAILHDDAEAEDCLQASWLLAFRAMGGFDGRSRLSTWLARIVVNESIGRSRRKSRRGISIEAAAPADDGETLVPASGDAGPEERALGAEACRLIERRILALPWSYREVFMLRAVDELSVGETARRLGIAEGTVRTRYFRARGMLRERLMRE